MCVMNRIQKKNNLMTKLTIVTSWKLISICIEFTILPGLPSTFKGFLSQSWRNVVVVHLKDIII